MADTTIMRRNNLQAILETIDHLGAATTTDLTAHTGLSLATISRVTGQLKTKGLIEQERKKTADPQTGDLSAQCRLRQQLVF